MLLAALCGCVAPGPPERAPAIAPPPLPDGLCDPVRFVALGDGRATADGVGPSAYWPGILGEALGRRPHFVLNTGDLVKDGRDPLEWSRYRATLPAGPRIWAVRGNHDRGPHFDAVGVGPFFSRRIGPVHLFGLDSEGSEAEFTRLVGRLDAALSASDAPWPVVFLHRPIWSRGNHGSDERDFNRLLVPVFDRHRVPLVFSGHDHDYERFCPSVGHGRHRRCASGGTTYVVTGGAATVTVPWPGLSRRVSAAQARADAAASRAFSGAHHFVQVDVRGGRLTGAAHATRTGNLRPPGVLDRFTLRREVPCPP